MDHRLVPFWINVKSPVYAVDLSQDGRHILVGSEQGVRIFDTEGNLRFEHPKEGPGVPFNLVLMTPDMSRLVVGSREGRLYRFDLETRDEGFVAHPLQIYSDDEGYSSLALSADGRVIAVGHLISALTMLKSSGQRIWRHHPDDGNATNGKSWTVALDTAGRQLWVGSAIATPNRLARLDAGTGRPQAYLYSELAIADLAVLPGTDGVLALFTDSRSQYRVVRYSSGLGQPLWQKSFSKPVTALAADAKHPILSISVGYEGCIHLLDAITGKVLAQELTLNALVNCMAMSGGRYLVAGTQDGSLAHLEYRGAEFQL